MNFFYKIWRTYFRVHSGCNCSCMAFPTKPVRYLGLIILQINDDDVTQNRNRLSNGESLTIRLLLQPSVSGITPTTRCNNNRVVKTGVAVSLLVSGLTVDILSTLCDVSMDQCVKLMLIIFENVGFYCLTVLLIAKM